MNAEIPVGKKIKLARQARSLSVRVLGAKVGFSGETISLIERGQMIPRPEVYEQIQAALGYRFDTPEAEAAFAFFLKPTSGGSQQ